MSVHEQDLEEFVAEQLASTNQDMSDTHRKEKELRKDRVEAQYEYHKQLKEEREATENIDLTKPDHERIARIAQDSLEYI